MSNPKHLREQTSSYPNDGNAKKVRVGCLTGEDLLVVSQGLYKLQSIACHCNCDRVDCRRELIAQAKAELYGLLADEFTDLANSEQGAACHTS